MKISKLSRGLLSKIISGPNQCLHSSEVCVNDLIKPYPELHFYIEEEDGRIIPHVADAIKNGFQRVVYSNDSAVAGYLLYYTHDFLQIGATKI